MAEHRVKAEVSGRIWKIEALAGQQVAEGDTLLVVESMKMEIPLSAPIAGTVQAIHVAEGDMVEEDQVLVLLGD